MEIREATAADWPAIWPIFRAVVAAQDSFVYDPQPTEQAARATWMEPPPGRVVVALDDAGTVLGTAKIGPNHAGPGGHVATASFMVAPAARSRGVGRALGEHALVWARSAGYTLMKFNAVAESNTRAVALWRSLGFEFLGTLPGGFIHPHLGPVGLHQMYRVL
jgi:L-amino acid N-acyltransferase YncA